MRLADYIATSRGKGAALAAELGMNPSYLSQMAHGHRPVPPALAAGIERATGGAVRRWDLRPDDWHRIWPEIVSADGAPPLKQAA